MLITHVKAGWLRSVGWAFLIICALTGLGLLFLLAKGLPSEFRPIKKLSGLDLLRSILREDSIEEKEAAAGRLSKLPAPLSSPEAQAVWIAFSKGPEPARLSAMDSLKDETILAELASAEIDSKIALAAVQHISAAEPLKSVAIQAKRLDAAQAALAKLNDRHDLEEIATRSQLPEVQLAAVGLLDTDEARLRYALTHEDHSLVSQVVEEIKDDRYLEDITFKHKDPMIQTMAVKKVRDPARLLSIWEHHPSPQIRQSAETNIRDPEAIKQLEEKKAAQARQKEEERRKWEIAHLEEQKRLQEIVANLRKSIRLGQSLWEVTKILGEPTKTFQMNLENLPGYVSFSSQSAAQRQYYVWIRPEGDWQLVFVNGILKDVYQTP